MIIRLISILLLMVSANTLAEIDTFDKGAPDTVPNNWMAGVTGKGVSDWKQGKDHTAPSSSLVLKQSGKGAFPWCIKR